MKQIFLLFLISISFKVNAQVSFFKDINTLESGSNPENFIEVNGLTFFTTNSTEGYRLWKTDGTEENTIKISDQNISSEFRDNDHYFQVFENELYYSVNNSVGLSGELWKTDGFNYSLVSKLVTNFKKIVLFNGDLFYLGGNSNSNYGIYKIIDSSNSQLISVNSSSFGPYLINNQMIFINQINDPLVSRDNIEIWKSDGTTLGTVLVKTILYHYPMMGSNKLLLEKIIKQIANKLYFFAYNMPINPTLNDNFYDIDLFSTDGSYNGTNFIKKIYNSGNFDEYKQPRYLTEFNNKLIFIANSKLNISDGTTDGTTELKNLQYFSNLKIGDSFGIINNKFYFGVGNGPNENKGLWESDGTAVGTKLLKQMDNEPENFTKINSKLLFKLNKYQYWTTDGTEQNTDLEIENNPLFARPSSNLWLSKAIYTSQNSIYFKNYTIENGVELWKSDGDFQNRTLVKNITQATEGSLVLPVKIKVGNTWYFNGSDENGFELWKSDGTVSGTKLVKDLAPGKNGLHIGTIVNIGSIIYFTATILSEYNNRLFRSDGTEEGTYEIIITENTIYQNIDKLLVTENLLFLRYWDGQYKYISTDGSSNLGLGFPTKHYLNYNILNSNLQNISYANSIGNTLYFILATEPGFWKTDGTTGGTIKILGGENNGAPYNPTCLTMFQGNLYFFSSFTLNSILKHGLFMSDGTEGGTILIKSFDVAEKLLDVKYLFLEKSANKLYFRVGYSDDYLGEKYINLWSSDGSENGTKFLKKISFDYFNSSFQFKTINDNFYMFINPILNPSKTLLLISDGTIDGTNIVFNKFTNFPRIESIVFKNKLYFSAFDNTSNRQLWTTEGKTTNTYQISNIWPSFNNTDLGYFMDFDDKLLFWANDGVRGHEPWQYLQSDCEANRNVAIKSGLWSDITTWACNHVPMETEIVVIPNGFNIIVDENIQIKIKNLYIEDISKLQLLTGSRVELTN